MQAKTLKPPHRKLFDNKYFTYVMNPDGTSGKIMEVELVVINKTIKYIYKKIKERQHA